MKAYQVVLLVVDHDELGADEMRKTIENVRYPNHCISPQVVVIEERDIGEWNDDHPLNKRSTADAEYNRLFSPNINQHHVADAFWSAWKENGETHKHGYFESTWIALRAALRAAGQ